MNSSDTFCRIFHVVSFPETNCTTRLSGEPWIHLETGYAACFSLSRKVVLTRDGGTRKLSQVTVYIVTCWVCHATNKFTSSGYSGYLLSFAYTITPYNHHFIIMPLAPSSAAVRLRLWSSVFGLRWALLPRGLSSRLEVTSCQGTISRVRRTVAPETLVIDSGNVFHLIRCHSTVVRCYRFVTVAVAPR
jgi:hypothetical protein